MKIEIKAALVAVTVSFGLHANAQSAGEQISRSVQAQVDNQNRLYQEKAFQEAILAKVRVAQQAAAQAAEYAKQAAPYDNASANLAAAFAQTAASRAQSAANRAPVAATERGETHPFSDELDALVAGARQAAANAKQAADQAQIDSIVSKINEERDAAVAKIKGRYDPDLRDLNFKLSVLQQKAGQLELQREQADKENARLRARQLFQPKDPWRSLNGKTYNAKDISWLHFVGKVLEIKANGILVHGHFGPPLEADFGERDYFVDNFPVQTYALADGESITAPMNFVAHLDEKASVYQFTNSPADLRVHTVRRLDYGQVVSTPPPELAKQRQVTLLASNTNPQLMQQLNDNAKEQAVIRLKRSQLEADLKTECAPLMTEYAAKTDAVPLLMAQQAEATTRAKEEAKKQALADRVLKSNQNAADRGDAFGLLRMGERYRDGDGVSKDLAKARDYLAKAAAAGSPSAAAELRALSPGKE